MVIDASRLGVGSKLLIRLPFQNATETGCIL